jgi:hypothetical protein
MNTYVYIHVCCINNWKDVFDKLISDIKESGLYEKVKAIRCLILTDKDIDNQCFNDPKIEIIEVSSNLNLYETVTLNHLYNHALSEDFNVLYLHTKGVRHNGKNPCVTDWVAYLSYFNIHEHGICLEMLKDYDTVGVNLLEPLHYSGNFWWAKSTHIKKLEKCKHVNYNSPEFWITSVKGDHKELWNSGQNHYYSRYTPDKYVSVKLL